MEVLKGVMYMRQNNKLLAAFLFIFSAALAGYAQKGEGGVSDYYLPKTHYLAFAAFQPDSPVQLERMGIIVEADAKVPFIDWDVRNNSSKPVKRIVVAFRLRTNIERWEGATNGVTIYEFGPNVSNSLIEPYSTLRKNPKEPNYRVNSALAALFSNLRENEDKKLVHLFGIIKRVEFADGSVFEEKDEVFEQF